MRQDSNRACSRLPRCCSTRRWSREISAPAPGRCHPCQVPAVARLLSSGIGHWITDRRGRRMATKKKGPADGKGRVKILPKDPLVAQRDNLWPVEIDLPCATPG